MDINLKRRARERGIAEEIAHALHQALGPIPPEVLGEKSEIVCGVFADAFDRNGIVSESAAERVLSYVPAVLAALNQSFAELNRRLGAAVRS